MSDNVDINVRSGYDSLLTEIAQYVSDYDVNSDLALETAKNCLIDTVGQQYRLNNSLLFRALNQN